MGLQRYEVARRRIPLALVHHANQYVICEGYAQREGIGEVLGMGALQRGLLPLLQLHERYRIPLNLHLSGTLLEAIVWHHPEILTLVKNLRRAGLVELIGSTFSQNVMTLFSDEFNRRQIKEELWLYRRHLDCESEAVKTFWVPERVWDTARLAETLADSNLPNGGYKYLLLDDRLLHPAGDTYEGSARARFDRSESRAAEDFTTCKIAGGSGLVMLPISKQLRYLIPPSAGDESFTKLTEFFERLAGFGDARTLAVYADDLEKAAGVGCWDPKSLYRYEQFLLWLTRNTQIEPVRVGHWATTSEPAPAREIEPGSFYELTRGWNAGEDLRGWIEDPECAPYLKCLRDAEERLAAAERRGADKGLLKLGWKHLLHCAYETLWHDPPNPSLNIGVKLAPWAAALASHARSCHVIAAAAEWARGRDGRAHAEMLDLDFDGEEELILKNDHLFAVLSPTHGGRIIYLFDLTGRTGRLVIGNPSDDWNWQRVLNRYMDFPRNHPGALADVGGEHDCYEPLPPEFPIDAVSVTLRNKEPGSLLWGTTKCLQLSAAAAHLCVSYQLPPHLWSISTEVSLSPNYYRLLRHGREGVARFDGADWRGWSNNATRAWVRFDKGDSTVWDKPYRDECGHGYNLRATSFAREFHLDLGVAVPPLKRCRRTETSAEVNPSRLAAKLPALRFDAATALQNLHDPHTAAHNGTRPSAKLRQADAVSFMEDAGAPLTQPITQPRFMRRFLNRLPLGGEVRKCRVRILKKHHDQLTLEYVLRVKPYGKAEDSDGSKRKLIGTWRHDERGKEIFELLDQLWRRGFAYTNEGLMIPQPLGHWESLNFMLCAKAPGKPLKEFIYDPATDWRKLLPKVAAWLAKLHNTPITGARPFDIERETRRLDGWLDDLLVADRPWLNHERKRVGRLLENVISFQRERQLEDLCLTHGDFHSENILVRGDTINVIDFEHSSQREPAADLGFFLGELEVQSDRYWAKRGRRNPLRIDELAKIFLDAYARTRPRSALRTEPVYRVRTYLKHLMYTVRMRGTERPANVTRWLDRADELMSALHGASAPSKKASKFQAPYRVREPHAHAAAGGSYGD